MSYQNYGDVECAENSEADPRVGEVSDYQFQMSRSFTYEHGSRAENAFDIATKGTDPYSIATYQFAHLIRVFRALDSALVGLFQ